MRPRSVPEPGKTGKSGFKYVALMSKRLDSVLLVAWDKAGINEKRFYKRLIAKADERFEQRLVERKRRTS